MNDNRDTPAPGGGNGLPAAFVSRIRSGLESDLARLRGQLRAAEGELVDWLRTQEGNADDEAGLGSNTVEREQDVSLAHNLRRLLEQTEHALMRIADGSYGLCESCGQPIGRPRLEAFPAATTCLPCKALQESRGRVSA